MMIAGFETPTAGDIAIDGRSVVALPPHKRNIGMVFQNYALFPHLTVAENIGFPLKQRGVDRAEARADGRARPGPGAAAGLPGDAIRGNFPAASSSAWRWRARSCSARGCC